MEGATWEVERPRRVLARDGEGEGMAWAVRLGSACGQHHLRRTSSAMLGQTRPQELFSFWIERTWKASENQGKLDR